MLLDVDIQLSQHNLLERPSFPPLSCLDAPVENQLTVYGKVYFQALYSLLHGLYICLFTYTYCLDYSNILLSFKIRKSKSSS